MKLSTRSRYGTRAMVELGLAYATRPVSAREMAESQRLSVKYLEHILAALKRAGVVTPVRGMRGGYILARPPASITLSEIFGALEGSPAIVDCVDHPGVCPMEDTCATRGTWVDVTAAVKAVLERTTLQDLVKRKKQKDSPTPASTRTSAPARSPGAGKEQSV